MMKRLLLGLLGVVLVSATLTAQPLSNQVLQLLTRINAWTATNTFSDLRLIVGVPSDTTLRFYVDGSSNLYFNGGLVAGAGGGVTPHNFLSTTHADTLASAVTRGSVVVGNATPAWAELNLCASGNYLGSNGTDTICATSAAGFTAIPAGQITGTASAFVGTAITALNATNLTSGTVPLARLVAITNTEISASAAIAYSKLNLTGLILNADIGAAAAIVYSKLALTNSVVTGDIAAATLLFSDWASNSCTNLQVAQYNGAAWVCKSLVTSDVTGAGTVSSVALSAPAIFAVGGSPVTTTGTLALTLATQAANLVWAGPGSGVAAAPTFRALVNLDLPVTGIAANTYTKLTINTAGVATAGSTQITLTTDVTGVLPMANGGSGVSVSADDTVLVGSGAAWVAQAVPNCVSGALAYTAATNAFSCNTAASAHAILSATHTDSLAATVVRGDVVVGNGTPLWSRLAIGTAGQSFNSSGTDPQWSATIAAGTLAASTPWTWTQTWNAAGVTFRGMELVITDTASAAASTGFRILGGAAGTTVEFSVDKNGAGVLASTLTTTGLQAVTAGSGTLGSTALPYATLVVGTAATNNLSITPAAFAQGTVATADDPALAAVKLGLVRRGTIAYTSGAIVNGTCATAVTATVTGLATTSTVVASLDGALQTNWQTGVFFYAYPTANTVNIRVCNGTAGSITPESDTFNYTAFVP